MSTKYVVAAAALATVAVTQTEATKFSIDRIKHPIRPHPIRTLPVQTLPALLDEEQADWNFNAGIQGGAGGRPQWSASIGAKWDEEQGFGRGSFPSSTGPYNPNSSRPWDEEQKLRLSKVVKGIKKANNVVNKAQQVGLLEEDAEQLLTTGAVNPDKFNINLSHNSAVKDGRNWKDEVKKAADLWKQAREAGFFDEDAEQADWNFNAGVSGGAGGRPQWNASIGAKWEEDEEQFRQPGKPCMGATCGPRILPIAPELLEEEQKLDLPQMSWRPSSIQRPAVHPAIPWDEEQKTELKKLVKEKWAKFVKRTEKKIAEHKAKKSAPTLLEEDAEQADWNFNAGIQGGAGGRPQWSASIGAKWEEEEQRFGRGGFPSSTGPYNPNPPSRGWDEEQADWNFNAGVSGGAGGRPQWNASIGAKWEEEEEQGFGSKLDKFIGRVDNTLTTIDRVKGLFDEDEQKVQASELIKLKKTCIKAKNTLKAAVKSKLLDEDEEQGFGSKLDRTLGRIDNTLNTIDRVKGLFQ